MGPDYRYLVDPREAGKALASLEGEREIAFDLEADSLHSYREKICLMQISSTAGNIIIDPFTCREAFGKLEEILGNREITKVVHGGDYDVRLLKKDFGFRTRNIFDTMVAAQLAGRGQHSLAALLEEEFSVRLEKKFQRADWSARPLSRDLLGYAALDTAWLIPLKRRLEESLKRLGRGSWAAEEFRLLEEVEPPPERKAAALDIKGSRRLDPRQQALLQRLVDIRDRAAQEMDRPPFKVLGSKVLLTWAAESPKRLKDLFATPGVSKRVVALLADDILVALAEPVSGEEMPVPRREGGRPMTKSTQRTLQLLKRVRREMEEELGLPPGLLLNNATLEKLSRMDAAEARAFMKSGVKSWQREVAGKKVVEVLTPAGV